MENSIVYPCEHPNCLVKGIADNMWNLKGTPRVILCGKHAYEARQRGLRAYRLSDTFAFDKRCAIERVEFDAFFAQYSTAGKRKGFRVSELARKKAHEIVDGSKSG